MTCATCERVREAIPDCGLKTSFVAFVSTWCGDLDDEAWEVMCNLADEYAKVDALLDGEKQ